MGTEKNLWFAFGLNLFFSVFEFMGGIVAGTITIKKQANLFMIILAFLIGKCYY